MSPRVLLVDDEPATLDVLCTHLENDGCTVIVATTGQAALRAANRARPDLVVLDVGLPDMDGYRTCERMLAQPAMAALPIVFLSATEEMDAEDRGRTAGGLELIRKRLPWDDILTRIRAHLPPGQGG